MVGGFFMRHASAPRRASRALPRREVITSADPGSPARDDGLAERLKAMATKKRPHGGPRTGKRETAATRERKRLFAAAYIVNLNATDAAEAAGYKGDRHVLAVRGREMLLDEDVQALIQAEMESRSKRTRITADAVLERLWAIATADPNDISQYRRGACRHCYGIDHAYQWTDETEWDEACRRATEKSKDRPDNIGGYGYDHTAEPAAECPRCRGDGIGRSHITDTRRLTGAARLLYAGIKETRDGIEAKMHDQMAAIDKLMRHLGMFKDKVEHRHVFEDMSDDEIEQRIAAYERGGNEA